MNKRKLGLTVGAVALVGALSVGGTLAFLTGTTNTATNVFTGDNNDLGGKIIEDFDQESASHYLPGDVITKVPTLTNDSDSIDAYAAVKVTCYVDGEAVDYADFAKDYATVDFNTDDWTEVADGYFMYNSVVAAGATTNKVFSKVSVLTGIKTEVNKTISTKYEYNVVDADSNEKIDLIEKNENGDLVYYTLVEKTEESTATVSQNGQLPDLKIVVEGYMVQEKNNTVDSAKAELLDLAGIK